MDKLTMQVKKPQHHHHSWILL